MRSSGRFGSLMKQIQGSATTGSVWKSWLSLGSHMDPWRDLKICKYRIVEKNESVKYNLESEDQSFYQKNCDQPEISLVELHALLSQLLSSDRRWRPARWGWWKDPEKYIKNTEMKVRFCLTEPIMVKTSWRASLGAVASWMERLVSWKHKLV